MTDDKPKVVRMATTETGAGGAAKGVPQGIEVLVKKAKVDGEFKLLLLEKRAEAARTIGLELTAAETAMINAAPAEQLEAIIAATKVKSKAVPILLGCSAAAMLVALGAWYKDDVAEWFKGTWGHRADEPAKVSQPVDEPQSQESK